MIYPSIDKILNVIDSKYELVHIISKRSKQMSATGHYQIPEYKYNSKKNLGRALEEISDNLIIVKKLIFFCSMINLGESMIKINKFTKLKDGNYKLSLEDGRELKIHEDLILKYDLLLTKNLDQTKENLLKEEQRIYDIYNIALKYIKVKVRSIKEIENYLLKKQFTKEETIEAISILKKQGYLNNEMYTKALIHDRICLSNDGPLKIKEELRKNGIEEDIIEKELLVFDEILEKERIQKLIDKQVKINRNRSNWMLKKKIENDLINLGYHLHLIHELLSKINIEDKNIYQQEYDKLYKKLSRKYEGKELEYKIKQKLYQKGFKNVEY